MEWVAEHWTAIVELLTAVMTFLTVRTNIVKNGQAEALKMVVGEIEKADIQPLKDAIKAKHPFLKEFGKFALEIAVAKVDKKKTLPKPLVRFGKFLVGRVLGKVIPLVLCLSLLGGSFVGCTTVKHPDGTIERYLDVDKAERIASMAFQIAVAAREQYMADQEHRRQVGVQADTLAQRELQARVEYWLSVLQRIRDTKANAAANKARAEK